jgi:hypothetical protein
VVLQNNKANILAGEKIEDYRREIQKIKKYDRRLCGQKRDFGIYV